MKTKEKRSKNYLEGFYDSFITDNSTSLGWQNAEKAKSWELYSEKSVRDYWQGYNDFEQLKPQAAPISIN